MGVEHEGINWDAIVDGTRERLSQETRQDLERNQSCGCPNCKKQADANLELLRYDAVLAQSLLTEEDNSESTIHGLLLSGNQ